MPLHPINPLQTKSPQKIHKRTDAICGEWVYAVTYLQLTSQTVPTSDKEWASPTLSTSVTSSMNIFLFLSAYNLAPALKGEFHESNAQEELGTFTPAAGSGRRAEISREEERLSGRGTEIYLPAPEGAVPGRDGLDHAALRSGMAGRAARLIQFGSTLTAHFDASAGTTSLSFVVPVLLSGLRKEEGDGRNNAGADRTAQAWVAPQADPHEVALVV